MTIEFIIRGGPDNDFDLVANQLLSALRPSDTSVAQLPGFGTDNFDINVEGVRISFSPEPPGWQVTMFDPPSTVWAERIAQAICANMSTVSGHNGVVIRI